jgi:glycosyltransferase involved in cell wall biosynthesis
MEISVIICTHNPRPHYLSRVLAALRSQTLPMARWELLVIDNASLEPLTSDTYDLSWHPRARLVREEELGLSAARIRGIHEATAALLVFVDDDNLLAADYLAQALKISGAWPQLGVWGGSVVHEYEVQPPDHLREFVGALGYRDVKAPRWSNVMPCSDATPVGAGLCVRADVAQAYVEHCRNTTLRMSGRCGTSLLSGEDFEICYAACGLGMGMGLFPELMLLHLIPSHRLTEDYLIRLAEGIHTTGYLLTYKWQGIRPRSLFAGLGVAGMLRDILYYRGIHRRMYLARLRGIVAARRIIAAADDSAPIRPSIAPMELP